ncbi:MAG: S41 family peptidase [Steroidobacteraceae bacterium]
MVSSRSSHRICSFHRGNVQQSVHLSSCPKKPSHLWTLPYVPGERFGPIPVYVLTSDMTFSGGEAFAYELQALKRATVVGEVTGGGAHLVSPERIDERFVIGVPTGRPINPITKTDWEGKGVIPDVKVPASEALVVAKGLASEALRTRSQGNAQ